MNHLLSDQAVREEALSPVESFIVQAPAGSGKTELLTQRFLHLLTKVSHPEQIIALTFTKKAANEMQERIFNTLNTAKNGGRDIQPKTLQIALSVLKHDQNLQWELLNNAHRLRVMTIDALCQWIVNAMPCKSSLAYEGKVHLFPEKLYRRAAQECFATCLTGPLKPHLLNLLEQLDNSQEKLLNLLSFLLTKRDQWLELIYNAKDTSKLKIEALLAGMAKNALYELKNSLEAYEMQDLQQFCQQLIAYGAMPDWAASLSSWHLNANFSLEHAKALVKLLLTSQLSFRKSADHHIGLKKEAHKKAEFALLKAKSVEIFAKLALNSSFYKALIHIHNLPASNYKVQNWDLLQSLFIVLVQLVAHLKVVFKEENNVDFSEVAETALAALGDEDNPTDLNLYLDYSIKHILIDEFQDTSFMQFKLISRLTAGWETTDLRTLFIVGDPMQSIYRFRQAEVGLFLKVREEGIGNIKLTPLYLTTNFRSCANLVTWVNQHLKEVFPAKENIALGEVTFHQADTISKENGLVKAYTTNSSYEEANLISEIIIKHSQEKAASIAVLVRSRSHLDALIPLLKAKQLAFDGVELVSLSNKAEICDLYALTQALLFPASKLAWFTVLRSPYVGLSLTDLHVVSLYENLEHPLLSEDGKRRLAHAKDVFTRAYALKDQQLLTEWILKTHLDLVGQHAVDQDMWPSFSHYFELVNSFTEKNIIQDFELFEKYFNKMYANQTASANVKIMTIHQAKGLEFDTVILPSMGRGTYKQNQELLRWAEVVLAKDKTACLFSPLKSRAEDDDPLYNYLGYLDKEKEKYERQRLLYVALTRAKKNLYLLDSKEKPDSASLRADLNSFLFIPYSLNVLSSIGKEKLDLYRIPLADYAANPIKTLALGSKFTQLTIDSAARAEGILIHRWIKWICCNEIKSLDDIPWEQISQETKDKESEIQIKRKFAPFFNSERGRWLIAKHAEAQNEFAFCVNINNKVATYIVDRLFLHEGKRWIIDFKTGLDDADSQLKHQEQVNNYAKYLSEYFKEPIACGLFYLTSQRWVSWAKGVKCIV